VPFRYAQFCPIARASELLGSRWSLLILRELFLGPQRFTDLRGRLKGVSTSVLTERLRYLEEQGVVSSRALPPPAATSVYELTPDGRAFWPAFREIARWGVRFMVRAGRQEGDYFDPDWVRLAALCFAATAASPELRVGFRVAVGARRPDLSFRVAGGQGGTRVDTADGPTDAVLRGDPVTLLGVIAGAVDPAAGEVELAGDAAAARRTPSLFDLDFAGPGGPVQTPAVH
jgi:DNA-binding HxlR family transcriptional regulator